MFFKGFKRKSNQLFLKKKLHLGFSNTSTRTEGKIQSLLILIENMDELDPYYSDLIKNLNLHDKDVTIIVYGDSESHPHYFGDMLSEKDFGWYGKIETTTIKNILTKKFDLLINYSKVENLYFNLLLLQCDASLKIGFAHYNQQLYDILIDCDPKNITVYNKELEKYLRILNKL